MPRETGQEDGAATLSDATLREAFVAAADPEVTQFLKTMGWVSAREVGAPVLSWREIVDPAEGADELGRLDGHILREVIAEGGMATVFRAEETALDRTVALKMLAPELAGCGPARDRFLREAKAAAALEHESVLPIYRVGDGDRPYFTMRHVSGGSLQERLDRGEAPDAAEWFALARQAAGALGAAHAAGIVHRDVKPANLLYEEGGTRVWVADFGIAASFAPSEGLGGADAASVLGTPRYMSPEQSRGEGVDGRSDLFALGAVLYRCAAGEDLVSGDTSAEVLEGLAGTDFAALAMERRGLSAPQRRLLSRLLAPAPADRFSGADEFLAALAKEEAKRRKTLTGIALAFAAMAAALALALRAVHPAVPADRAENLPPALPSIRIEGGEAVFRDLEAALSAAPDGATLLLDGVFVCRTVHFGPVGRRLSLRSAPGATALVVASRPDEHALFLRGPTTLVGIDFLREASVAPSKPIVGIHGGEAVVRDCRFAINSAEDGPLVAALSFTYLGRALVEDCVFDLPGTVALSYGFHEGSPPMEVTLRDSVVLGGSLAVRRVWEGDGQVLTRLEGCALAVERLFLEQPRNDPSVSSPAFVLDSCWVGATESTILIANGRPVSPDFPTIDWQGRGNRHARPGLRLARSLPESPLDEIESVEVAFGESLGRPFSGAEVSPTIRALRPSDAESFRMDQLLEALIADPEFSRLARIRPWQTPLPTQPPKP